MLAQDAGEAQMRRKAQQSINTILIYLNSAQEKFQVAH
jgi:hypothetical protein